MVSRRRILSRSRDDLNMEAYQEEEEDVWYKKEKLYSVSTRPYVLQIDHFFASCYAFFYGTDNTPPLLFL